MDYYREETEQIRAAITSALWKQQGVKPTEAQVDQAFPLFISGVIFGVKRARQEVKSVFAEATHTDVWPDVIGGE